jgi:SAM-dependent methyltransferase
MSKHKDILPRLRSATTTDELMEAYRDWADSYDSDLLEELGYVAPAIACDALKRYVKEKDSRILDVGCGTGIVGAMLHRDGYRVIDGIDYSPEMLKEAQEKGIYQRLIHADVREKLDIPDGSYDAIISVGTFTMAHLGPDAFRELIRITGPDGCICVTVREEAWVNDNFPKVMGQMEAEGIWTPLELETCPYIQEENSTCKLVVYRTNTQRNG